MRRHVACAALLAATVGSGPTPAQVDGSLDAGFGASGSRRIPFDLTDSTLGDAPAAVAVEPGGRIVVAGAAQNGAWGIDGAIARLDSSGNLDPGFGSGGRIVFGFANDDPLTDVLVLPDGRVLVAGTRPWGWGPDPEIFVQAFGASGAALGSWYQADSLDAAWPAAKLARDPASGKILVGYTVTYGSSTFVRVVRLNGDLSRDSGYGFLGSLDVQHPGGVPLALADLEVLEDGTLVVAGSASTALGFDFFVARADAAGWLDAGFGAQGCQIVPVDLAPFGDDFAASVAADAQRRILIAGVGRSTLYSDRAAVLVRLTADGAVDSTFNGGEPLVVADTDGDDALGGLAVQSDGRIAVAGKVFGPASPMFFAARYWPDGSADWSFGSFGVFTANFPSSPNDDYAVALALSGGRPVLVGPAEWSAPDYDFGVMRLNSALVFADDLERGSTGAWSLEAP